MKRLMYLGFSKELLEVYRNNHIFNSVVCKHEKLGSSYEVMLEGAVVSLARALEQQNKECAKLLARSGGLQLGFTLKTLMKGDRSDTESKEG